jgi:hypothetical protein
MLPRRLAGDNCGVMWQGASGWRRRISSKENGGPEGPQLDTLCPKSQALRRRLCKTETGKAKADEQNRRRLRDRCGPAGSELVHRRGRERFVINSKVIDDAVETEDPGDSKVLRGEGG